MDEEIGEKNAKSKLRNALKAKLLSSNDESHESSEFEVNERIDDSGSDSETSDSDSKQENSKVNN